MNNRNGFLGIPFSWLFAIIVGAIIIFFAIIAVTKIKDTQEIAIDVQTSKQIGVLLNPLETGFETARTTSMTLPSETRIFSKCDAREGVSSDFFGRQIIQVSQKSFGTWTETDVDVGFSNKYIFSEEFVEGRKFFLFSKPFDFPFKVADLIYITSSDTNYCFENPPKDIEEEIDNLNQNNLFLEDCPSNSIVVCFGGNCDIEVDMNLKFVERGTERMYFDDTTLMFGAIFSEPEIYECKLKRLMKRGNQLSQIYFDKSILISREGCFSGVDSELLSLIGLESGFVDSAQSLRLTSETAGRIGELNEASDCKLW